MKKRTICIDFDGVLHDYSEGFKGKDVFGDMLPNADKGTHLLKKKGWTIIIYTTRPKTAKLEKWLKDHKIAYDYINENPNQPEDSKGGKLIADIYLDDRGMRFKAVTKSPSHPASAMGWSETSYPAGIGPFSNHFMAR